MIQLLSLFKNPIVKMGINKVSSHFQHKAEKQKVIRAAEIEAAKDTDLARIKSQDNSIKDERLMAWLIAMLTPGWIHSTRDKIRDGVTIRDELPDTGCD